jgi:hypothetical protein
VGSGVYLKAVFEGDGWVGRPLERHLDFVHQPLAVLEEVGELTAENAEKV